MSQTGSSNDETVGSQDRSPASGDRPPLTVLLLAGGLSRSPLSMAMGFPVPGMPLGPDRTVLGTWLDLLADLRKTRSLGVHFICSNEPDLDWFRAEQRRLAANFEAVSCLLDPRPHRGVAGVLADVVASLKVDGEILVLELTALPPPSLSPLLEAAVGDPATRPMLTVGSSEDERPAGVYLFASGALRSVPRLGYHDLKEQLIPHLLSNGHRIVGVSLGETAVRLVDRRNYLRGVRIWGSRGFGGAANGAVDAHGVSGHSIVCEGAVVEDGGVVLDSVVMPGARIASTAVVARSVIGPMMVIPDGAVIVDAILADPSGEPFQAMAAMPSSTWGTAPDSQPGWSC
jgi:hypothetical protein